jgi:16S rRNA (uracil1498-N3)-methyltransferase
VSAGPSPSPRSAAAHVFVEDLAEPRLDPADDHHLRRVRRLRDGDTVTVGDGRGRWRPAIFAVTLEPSGPIVVDPPPAPPITIAFAPAKGERPEWVVQKLTELGIDRIVPLVTERGVVRWDEARAPRQVERWGRIAREAAAQSRRTWLPEVTPPVPFAEAVRWAGAALAEAGGARPTLARAVVLTASEGGWAPEERGTASALGVPLVGLGAHVLRAETAAVAAGVLLAAERLWRSPR